MATDDTPRPDELRLDARTLRGLAHPLRVRILGMLRSDGPATATSLAEHLGLSSAATSYHLRQLALYGFIVEDETLGQPRERWWRAAHRSTTFDLRTPSDADPQTAAAGEVYLRSVTEANARQMLAAVDEMLHLPEAWRGVGALNDILLRLTPQQAEDLSERMWAIVADYPRADEFAASEGDGTRRVTVQLQVFPRPGDPL